MPSGKSTEQLRNTLDHATAPVSFNKTAAWENLEKKLEKKKGSPLFKRLVWIAAAVTGILIFTLVSVEHKPGEAILTKIKPANTIIQPVIPQPSSADNKIIVTNQSANQKRTIKNPAVTNQSEISAEINKPDSIAITAAIPVPAIMATQEENKIVAIPKKLKVYTNNELISQPQDEVLPPAWDQPAPLKGSLLRKRSANIPALSEPSITDATDPQARKRTLFGIPVKNKN